MMAVFVYVLSLFRSADAIHGYRYYIMNGRLVVAIDDCGTSVHAKHWRTWGPRRVGLTLPLRNGVQKFSLMFIR